MEGCDGSALLGMATETGSLVSHRTQQASSSRGLVFRRRPVSSARQLVLTPRKKHFKLQKRDGNLKRVIGLNTTQQGCSTSLPQLRMMRTGSTDSTFTQLLISTPNPRVQDPVQHQRHNSRSCNKILRNGWHAQPTSLPNASAVTAAALPPPPQKQAQQHLHLQSLQLSRSRTSQLLCATSQLSRSDSVFATVPAAGTLAARQAAHAVPPMVLPTPVPAVAAAAQAAACSACIDQAYTTVAQLLVDLAAPVAFNTAPELPAAQLLQHSTDHPSTAPASTAAPTADAAMAVQPVSVAELVLVAQQLLGLREAVVSAIRHATHTAMAEPPATAAPPAAAAAPGEAAAAASDAKAAGLAAAFAAMKGLDTPAQLR